MKRKTKGTSHAIIYTDMYGKDHNLGTVYGNSVDVDRIANERIRKYKTKRGIYF